MSEKSVFKTLSEVDVSKFTEKKNNLTYLSWTYAWANVVEKYPDANYEIIKNENNLPYFEDESGAMVYTKVTIEGITREMWLPVMDGTNKSMKKESYNYEVINWEWDNKTRKKVKNGTIEKKVEAISMFDVNKTVMRCLVKNLAMFGLGINVYAGEDLPLDLEPEKLASEKQVALIKSKLKTAKLDEAEMLRKKGFKKIEDFTAKLASETIDNIDEYIKQQKAK